jgi:NADPH:quinone reductase-like Zn-dependent oxidoreductase
LRRRDSEADPQNCSQPEPPATLGSSRSLYQKGPGPLDSAPQNNWVNDKYDWSKEIVLITGGSVGIGACMVKLLDEMKVTVVVLDVQKMTYAACKS